MGLDRSHIEDDTLRHSSWYQAGIPRYVNIQVNLIITLSLGSLAADRVISEILLYRVLSENVL